MYGMNKVWRKFLFEESSGFVEMKNDDWMSVELVKRL